MTQKQFYRSSEWIKCREAFIASRISIDGGMCQKCRRELGYIVHHTVWLNDTNCNDPAISLNQSLLRYDCLRCHNGESEQLDASRRFTFADDGSLIRNSDY